jgi:molybdopterin synthase catalytic subunit
MIDVRLQAAPLAVAGALDSCDEPGHGAASLFVGRVRDINEGRRVVAVTYDLHEALCRVVFEEICGEGVGRWPGARLALWHRWGRLAVGEASVVAAASARHRDHAFDASRYLVEQMKLRAPIWKQEHYTDGDDIWTRGHSLVPSR